jgi:hypothetical protein
MDDIGVTFMNNDHSVPVSMVSSIAHDAVLFAPDGSNFILPPEMATEPDRSVIDRSAVPTSASTRLRPSSTKVAVL